MVLLDALRNNLAKLTDFSGREARGSFLIYAGFVVPILFAGIFLAMVPEMFTAMERMQTFAAENPELATVTQNGSSYSIRIEGHHPELMPDFGAMFAGMSVIAGLAVLLLGASVSRRLHDTGKTGFLGLLPLPFLAFAFILMPRLFAAFTAEPGSDLPFDPVIFAALFLNNMVYLATLALLIYLLTRDSTPGENKYGPALEKGD